MATTQQTATVESISNQTPCVDDKPDCPGPDVAGDNTDDLPCFHCYTAGVCLHGQSWCDNRSGADGENYCRACALRTRKLTV
ncbi:hypothetical protein BV210_02465 [Halorientalis sp. IM1011]|uniref:hypothetical protein n=1 Tax=Halorientalis sp. IM1011 TaxID=1932360 RepID=UPI00097CD3C4|nr:hypothetical protein [Halorientalis sp. IM1011]AQL41646.1 hypothetical protein BV210_02465 [Halorientalis sp. IM1011]